MADELLLRLQAVRRAAEHVVQLYMLQGSLEPAMKVLRHRLDDAAATEGQVEPHD